jgi:hypothetical protein
MRSAALIASNHHISDIISLHRPFSVAALRVVSVDVHQRRGPEVAECGPASSIVARRKAAIIDGE